MHGSEDGRSSVGDTLPLSIARAWRTFDVAKQIEYETKEQEKAEKSRQQKIMQVPPAPPGVFIPCKPLEWRRQIRSKCVGLALCRASLHACAALISSAYPCLSLLSRPFWWRPVKMPVFARTRQLASAPPSPLVDALGLKCAGFCRWLRRSNQTGDCGSALSYCARRYLKHLVVPTPRTIDIVKITLLYVSTDFSSLKRITYHVFFFPPFVVSKHARWCLIKSTFFSCVVLPS